MASFDFQLKMLPFCSQKACCRQHPRCSGKPLAFANVLLLAAKDSALVRGSFSTEQGVYLFENVPAGAFLLSYTMWGLGRGMI